MQKPLDEACATCQKYEHKDDDLVIAGRAGTTGYCTLVKLSSKRRRTHKDTWCDQYTRAGDREMDRANQGYMAPDDIETDAVEAAKPLSTERVLSEMIEAAEHTIEQIDKKMIGAILSDDVLKLVELRGYRTACTDAISNIEDLLSEV